MHLPVASAHPSQKYATQGVGEWVVVEGHSLRDHSGHLLHEL